jgi:hypothetical protein
MVVDYLELEMPGYLGYQTLKLFGGRKTEDSDNKGLPLRVFFIIERGR